MNNPITIPDSDEELLKECDVNTFRSGGKGGQHLNKTESAVRLTHIITGIVVTCQNGRSQYKNKRQCLTQLRKKLEKLNYQDPVRIPTKKPMKERERILKNKKKHSIKKQLRQKPEMDD